ncbi:DUF1836 domain-containing protein [Paenibacillus sp. 1001270B_150601_E10]|uniref:DUF1836 domain-containing protein n=1 Tax=Paenibacillus sp. 1001270B_150601_E10 TaxID=2787079 RepID=UPI00189CDD9D|nr:DUF1836 domain-containing protein [Paenibacillus sp. 1001270B_150601_E10]
MESLTFSRKQMSQLLYTLAKIAKQRQHAPAIRQSLQELQEEWLQNQQGAESINSSAHKLTIRLPFIVDKFIRSGILSEGLSLNEIVALGNHVEYTNFSVTSVQNWVKREIRSVIGSPRLGKKYDLQQAAIILIVEDLRSTLTLDEIRHMLTALRIHCQESEPVIEPLKLYQLYSTLYEVLDQDNDQIIDVHLFDPLRHHHDGHLESVIRTKTEEFLKKHLPEMQEHQVMLRDTMVIALASLQTIFFQYLSRQYLHSMLKTQTNLEG